VSRPVARYRPSRRYILFALLAICGTAFCAWTGLRWPTTWVAAGLFGITSVALMALLWQPSIEIHETHLQIGRRVIFWREIRRLDQTGWIAPLAVTLTLSNDRRVILLYAGDLDSSTCAATRGTRCSTGFPIVRPGVKSGTPRSPARHPSISLLPLPTVLCCGQRKKRKSRECFSA
jgi:hypothetical protein